MLRQGMPPTDPTRKPLVLRVEIAPEQIESFGALLAAPQAAAPSPPVSAPARLTALEEADLRRRKSELEDLQARLTAEQLRLQESARELAEREAELEATRSDEVTASDRIRLAHRSKRVQELEHELESREELLDERESDFFHRQAAFEADVELREERIESWRGELVDLETKLKRKEAELLAYVAQLQEEFVRRETAGWDAVAAHIRH